MKVNGRASADASQPVRVLLSLDPPDGTTRYVDQIVTHIPGNVQIIYFSWAAALFGHYDVFHVHWPEFLVRADTPVKTRGKRALANALIARLRRRRTAVVRTLHNPSPHEGVAPGEANFIEALDRLTSVYVRLNTSTEPPDDRPCETILHGDYIERFAPLIERRSHARQGVLLSAGLIRPYKGILELIGALAGVRHDLTLRIVGKPVDAAFQGAVEAAAQHNSHVFMHFGFIPDRQLVEEILEAECVVLPYRTIHNSGMLFVALSLGRPVLVPRADTTEALQREVGAQWIQFFDGDIDSGAIDRAVDSFRASKRSDLPHFEGRDWPTVGRRHAEVYALALGAGSHQDAKASAL
ncbi:GDP-mannose:glycolipid 4-beta-D-mannosyltransferase [Rhodococcoides trifolii]|uniref:GDP-mannose:glycolipid 4-beta-D-mannosyltransferase n=1 Tax=Rhodococcoides trifolii TaxID=908250 RepID=A0A917G8X2_9NOCA|nr:hypothetical protein [Rhodococcus trifolii]GGG29213.1 GDP-mannose:glycolipid 4-beta-D-mannosyltransferase [Rhodococcus trifolii]